MCPVSRAQIYVRENCFQQLSQASSHQETASLCKECCARLLLPTCMARSEVKGLTSAPPAIQHYCGYYFTHRDTEEARGEHSTTAKAGAV